MYEVYDLLDGRTIRLFESRATCKKFMSSGYGQYLAAIGYSWRRWRRR